MSLNDDDKDYFRLVIETSINGSMKPVMDKLSDHELSIQRHEQSLYGAEGNNGLNGDNKKHKAFQRTVVFVFAVLQALQVGAAAYVFLSRNTGAH
jgi:hypothetical protein